MVRPPADLPPPPRLPPPDDGGVGFWMLLGTLLAGAVIAVLIVHCGARPVLL